MSRVIPRALTGATQTLLTLAAAGDPAAVQQCVTRYGSLVWSIVRRSCANEVEAEALTSEVFALLWHQAGRYDANMGSEALFITMVARRCVLDRLRATEPRPSPHANEPLASETPTPIERCPEATLAAGVLATLDPSQRRTLSLVFGQNLTYAEAAKAIGGPTGAAKSLVRRALVAVRKRLQARQGEALRE